VFAGVDLKHRRGPVPGLPHDRVRVGAGPECFCDKPGPQRMPTPNSWICAGVNPAAAARRRIISFTASPDMARVPMAPVLWITGNSARPGIRWVLYPGGAADMQHGILVVVVVVGGGPLLPSPTTV